MAYTAYIMLIDKYGKEMNEDQMTLVILLSVALIILGERVTALGLLGSALLLSSFLIAVIKKI